MSSVQSTTDRNYNPFDLINATGQQDKSLTASSIKEQQDRFLNLLVTQLKNQDPLNPMDNAQMTSQLAQMSTVSGIEKLNATLNTLLENLGYTQSMEASALIGKSVLVAGDQLTLGENGAYGGVKLEANADKVILKILNSAGQVVQSQDLGAREAGVFNFAWDGKADDGSTAAAGNYKFTVEAAQGGKPVNVGALQLNMVSALVRSGNSFLLDLGSLGRLDFKDVQQII